MSFASRNRAKQLIDFETLRYGNCLYTDIDATTEWHGKLFVFLELKYREAELPLAQRLYFEHICYRIERGGAKAIAIVAEHYVKDSEIDIVAGECIVREVYHDNAWHNATCKISVSEYAHRYMSKYM